MTIHVIQKLGYPDQTDEFQCYVKDFVVLSHEEGCTDDEFTQLCNRYRNECYGVGAYHNQSPYDIAMKLQNHGFKIASIYTM